MYNVRNHFQLQADEKLRYDCLDRKKLKALKDAVRKTVPAITDLSFETNWNVCTTALQQRIKNIRNHTVRQQTSSQLLAKIQETSIKTTSSIGTYINF